MLNLENIGLEDRVGVFNINLLKNCSTSYGIKQTEITDEWMETYLNFMSEATNIKSQETELL